MNLKKKLYELVHNQPYGTDEVILVKDIIIPYNYNNRCPKQWKIDRAVEFYRKHNYIDKPISVVKIPNEKTGKCKYLLIDEYTRYLAIRSQSNKFAPVKYIEILQ